MDQGFSGKFGHVRCLYRDCMSSDEFVLLQGKVAETGDAVRGEDGLYRKVEIVAALHTATHRPFYFVFGGAPAASV